MPRVPFVPQIGRQVGGSQGFSPGRQVTPLDDQTGTQLRQFGGALADAGGVVSRIGMHVQDQIDDATVKSNDALLTEEATLAKVEYRQKIGLDAVRAKDEYLKRVSDRRAKLEATLSNDRQRADFKLQADRTMLEHTAFVEQHYGEQSRTFEIGAASGRLEGAIEARNVAMLAGQTEAAKGHEETVDAEVRRIASLQGVAPESVGGLIQKARTKMHAQMLDQLADGPSSVMSAYFDAHKAEMDLDSRAKAQDAVGRATLRDEGKRVADWVASKSSDPAEQRKILDTLSQQGLSTDVFDNALGRLRKDADDSYQSRVRSGNDAVNEATTFLQQNRATARTFEDLPVKTQQQLVLSGRDGDVRRFLAMGGQRITTTDGQAILNRAVVDPTFLRGRNWTDVEAEAWGHLDEKDTTRLADLFAKANNKPSGKQLPDGEINRAVRLWMIDKGFYPDPRSGKKPTDEHTYRLELMLDRMTRKFQGKDVSDWSTVDAALSEAMGSVLSVGGKNLPRDMTTNDEFEAGSYSTPYGPMDVNRLAAPEVQAELGLIEQRIRDRNRELAKINASLPPEQRVALLPEGDAAVAAEYRAQLWRKEQAQKAAAARASEEARKARTLGPTEGAINEAFRTRPNTDLIRPMPKGSKTDWSGWPIR